MTELQEEIIEGDFKEKCAVVIPVGSVIAYAGASAPDGWALCYGQAISRTTYANLFTVLGTTYGVGDSSTTFNVPDLRGRRPFGKDDMGGSGTSQREITTATMGNTALTDPASTTLGDDEGASVTLNFIIKVKNTLPDLSISYPSMP